MDAPNGEEHEEEKDPNAKQAQAPRDEEGEQQAEEQQQQEADDEPSEEEVSTTSTPNDASSRKRRTVAPQKLDLYRHFTTLTTRATTRSGKDLGMYLCVCRYCQEAADRGQVATPPTPLVRTRRNCLNHHKRCPYLPPRVKEAGPPPPPTASSKKLKATTQQQGNNATSSTTATATATWQVTVDSSLFCFDAAHFIAGQQFREALHGHAYQGTLRLLGGSARAHDILPTARHAVRALCAELSGQVLLPAHAPPAVLTLSHRNVRNVRRGPSTAMVRLDFQADGAFVELPAADCVFLPVMHTSLAQLAGYAWNALVERMDAAVLRQHEVQRVQVELRHNNNSTTTTTTFGHDVPTDHPFVPLHGRTLAPGAPTPCCGGRVEAHQQTTSRSTPTQQLDQIATALHGQGWLPAHVTGQTLQALLLQNNTTITTIANPETAANQDKPAAPARRTV